MKICAYNIDSLNNLNVLRKAKQYCKSGMITKEQWTNIQAAYKSDSFSPNIFIRILLFIAAFVALCGVTALLAIPFISIVEDAIFILCILYGIGSFVLLDLIFVKKLKNYKSGVTEMLLYHSVGFTIGGFIGMTDGNIPFSFIVSFLVLSVAAIRYIDFVTTVAAILTAASFLFYILAEIGGWAEKLIPFAFIVFFLGTYFIAKKNKKKSELYLWRNCLEILEVFSLLFIYIGGNYLVVRELSVQMMNMMLEAGHDIPFAIVFYSLTVLVPVVYIFLGVRNKDITLIRIGVIALFFTVFTFKYYYSLGHPEITFTIGGLILTGVAIYLLNYLKIIRNGYTREQLIAEKWTSLNAEAFIISQTMGGNQHHVHTDKGVEFGGGGGFDGGGAGRDF